MAKTKSEKTNIQLAADKAREAYSKAKEANEKTDNASTQKALADAKNARDAAVSAERRERFERVGGGRVGTALTAIKNVGKLNVPASYSYTENDVAKAESALKAACENAIAGLRAALTSGGASKSTEAGFKF